MADRVLAETAVSISEHKKNPMATLAAGAGIAVAVLNRNEPAFYCVPARAYEDLMDLVDDLERERMPNGSVQSAVTQRPGAPTGRGGTPLRSAAFGADPRSPE